MVALHGKKQATYRNSIANLIEELELADIHVCAVDFILTLKPLLTNRKS